MVSVVSRPTTSLLRHLLSNFQFAVFPVQRQIAAMFYISQQSGAVRPVLAKERFPWYDADTERVKPILPWPDLNGSTDFGGWISRRFEWLGRWFRWMNGWRFPGIGGIGDLVAIGLAMLFLTLLIVLLLELLRRYRPLTQKQSPTGAVILATLAQRIQALPAGVRLDFSDPLAQARRLRKLGDYGGAVVHLFAHQILTLEKLGQVRLLPGLTGRQLVRSVGNQRMRDWVEPTLRIFESVYYGGNTPTEQVFEEVWSNAEEREQGIVAKPIP